MSQNVPKINYNNGIIYKLCCNDTNITEFYIGSTTNLRNRKNRHKNACNNINYRGYNYPVYKFIRDNGGFDNWNLILVEKYSAVDKLDLLKRERYYIETLKPILNSKIPLRTYKEYNKEYYKQNKNKIKEYYKQNKNKIKEYRKQNKDIINANQSILIQCECGAMTQKKSIARHKKTQKHITKINNLSQS